MTTDEPIPVVVNNEQESRFEIRTEDGIAILLYRLLPGAVNLIHTEVPEALAGRRVGSTLARAALDWARERNLRVIPTCPFVRAYIARHPEYASLVQARGAASSG